MSRPGAIFEVLRGGVWIVAAPEHEPPFAVDAIVEEEDTFLVLSAEPDIPEVQDHPLRILQDAMNAEPVPPGSVIYKDAAPPRLLAVVHDLSDEPTWREDWIQAALAGVLDMAEERHIRALALPFIGTIHGRLRPQRFVTMLRRALDQATLSCLRKLWLVVPAGVRSEVLTPLQAESRA